MLYGAGLAGRPESETEDPSQTAEIRDETASSTATGGENPSPDDDRTHFTQDAVVKRLGTGSTVTEPRSVLFRLAIRVYAG